MTEADFTRADFTRITDSVHAMRIPFEIADPSGLRLQRFVYVYTITGDSICLVDSGVASSGKIIFGAMEEMDRRPGEISHLVLTHSHPDHIGGARAVRDASGCAVIAHLAERAWIEDIDLQFRERPVPGFHSLVGGSVKVDQIVEDGDILKAGGLDLQVIHTPGHSRGSISLLLKDEGILFSGDAIPVPGDMPIYDDPVQSMKSIEGLKALEGVKVLLSAWDVPRKGREVERSMDGGLLYLRRIHRAIEDVAGEGPLPEPLDFCREVLARLGLPGSMANPLVARSFLSNLEALRGRTR